MNKLEERDPKVDPRPGDVVREPFGGPVRTVTRREGSYVWYVTETCKNERKNYLLAWMDWCRNNT